MTPPKEIWLVESPTAFWFSREPVYDLPDDCVVTHMIPAQPEQEQLMSDQINYGMSVTQGGKRIDPMSIYKEPEQEPCCYGGIAHDCHAGEGCRIVKRMKAAQPEQDGECKYCTDGCPACDARKLPKEAHDLF